MSASPFLGKWSMPGFNYKQMHIVEQMLTLPARLGIQDYELDDNKIDIPMKFHITRVKKSQRGAVLDGTIKLEDSICTNGKLYNYFSSFCVYFPKTHNCTSAHLRNISREIIHIW